MTTANRARSIRRRRSRIDGKKLPVRSFGMASSTSPRCGGDHLRAVPVALRRAGLDALAGRCSDSGGQLRLDQFLKYPGEARADGVGHLAGLDSGEQGGQVMIGEGHRRGLLRVFRQEHVELHAGDPPQRWTPPATPREGTRSGEPASVSVRVLKGGRRRDNEREVLRWPRLGRARATSGHPWESKPPAQTPRPGSRLESPGTRRSLRFRESRTLPSQASGLVLSSRPVRVPVRLLLRMGPESLTRKVESVDLEGTQDDRCHWSFSPNQAAISA
jgi:hypothetical protein